MNTLMPLGNRLNQSVKNMRNAGLNAMKNITNVANIANVTNSSSTGLYISAAIFITLIITFVVIFTFFSNEISYGWNNFTSSLRTAFGTPLPAPPTDPETPPLDPSTDNILEKVMPGSKQVFNISSNRYTFYDAEPLCKALGAELATYDQVKSAWSKGADWCNYGWVKGQQALYPTQKETYDKLQYGPEGDRLKCGQPGVNGGYFDNPEERFGVNCFGPKPPQSLHDAITLEKGAPVSPDVIEYNRKVAKFKTNADNLGILPYNSEKWES